MITDLKLQNEIKVKTAHVSRTDPDFRALNDCIQKIFKRIEFDENKDWNISLAIKNDPETGSRLFTGTLKMTDKQITGDQLQIFSEYQNELEAVEN